MIQLRFRAAVENGRLIVRIPTEESLQIVEVSATTSGDTFFLSETDKQVLAIASEMKKTHSTKLVTDDYAIQNVATKLGIEFVSLATYGIRRLLEWIRYCPACRREYRAEYKSTICTVCGTELKRKPKKNLRTLQPQKKLA